MILNTLIFFAQRRGWIRHVHGDRSFGWNRDNLLIITRNPSFDDPPDPHPTGGAWWGCSADPAGKYRPAKSEAWALWWALWEPRHRQATP